MIMEAIYNGHFCPTEDVRPQDPRYHQKWKLIDDLMINLKARLNQEDFALVQQIMDHTEMAYSMESEEFFKLGFSSGLQLQKEVRDALTYLEK